MKPDTPKKKRLYTGLAFLGIAALASASIFATGPRATPEVPSERAWPVSVARVEPGTIAPTFTAFGRVESRSVAKLRTDVVAEILAVHVTEGQWVQRGEELARLDDRALELTQKEREADLARERAALRSARTEYELLKETTDHYRTMFDMASNKLKRHEELRGRQLIAQSLVDEVLSQANEATISYQNHRQRLMDMPNRIAAQQAIVDKAEVMVAQARLDVEKTRITAPFSGPVMAVLAAPGDYTNLGAPIVTVADASGFEVRVQIPNPEIADQLAAGKVTATTERGVALSLVRIARQVRSGQTGRDAFFAFADPDAADIPDIGTLVNVDITLPLQHGVVALPVQSIFENTRIYRIQADDRLQAIDIQRVGERKTPDGHQRVLVRSPAIAAGDRIITTQLPKAITGLLVSPITADAGIGVPAGAEDPDAGS